MTLKDIRKHVLELVSGKRTRTSNCWVCQEVVETPINDVWRTSHQDTLGGAWSFPACDSCIAHRGSTARRVADLVVMARTKYEMLPEDDAWDLNTEQKDYLATILKTVDADGEKHGHPVHVCENGFYFTIADWVKMPQHRDNVLAAQERYRQSFSEAA